MTNEEIVMVRKYKAGILAGNTYGDERDYTWWSRHSRADLAFAAARRYARGRKHQTGGAGSWSGYVQRPDGSIVEVCAG